ncbi:MAG: ABC transporter substrate-binding protein [Clostridium sp.]|uniref:ABC transporter substrate-binding protein n=1 Tax=Clostridium sp. TaxID=1506 RepID=UPI003F412E19
MKKTVSLIMVLVVFLTITAGCGKKNKGNEEISLYYNTEDIKTFTLANEIIKEFEKEYGLKVNIHPVTDNKEIEKNIQEGKENSVLLLDGYNFSEFANKNYLRDLGYLYKSKDTREKFSYITNIYAIYNNKYYGIGLMPYSLELIYNNSLLKDKGITVEDNNINDLFKKLNDKNIKIPTYIKSKYSKEVLLSALVANDSIIYDLYKTNSVNDIDKKIDAIENGQEIFKKLNDLYVNNTIRENMFIDGEKEAIKDFNDGKTPVILTTTLSSNDIRNGNDIGLANKMHLSNEMINAPVGVDLIVCSSVGNSKGDEVDKFLRFLLKSEPFELLSKQNCITGNKMGDSNLEGIHIKMANSIHAAAEINILYIDSIAPNKVDRLNKEVKNVLSGKYDGNEWTRVKEK